MLFNSAEYFVLLFVTLAVYWSVPPARRRPVLLAASYVFYAWWGIQLAGLLALATIVTFVSARLIDGNPSTVQRRVLFGAGLVSTFVPLLLFKYIGAVLGVEAANGAVVLPGGPATSVLVPIGLSYYTFQSASYLIDVRRGVQAAERSFVDYALFVAFFPQLIAGPILRARRLIPEMRSVPARPDPVRFSEGVELLVTGLFKKVALADPLLAVAGGDVLAVTRDQAERTGQGSGSMVLVALVATVLATYLDLSGYVDMARGSAKLFGIHLAHNFGQPLTRSRSVTDFWRRWQITLMAWFRDYVFTPLRGRRRPTLAREIGALTLTFVVVGIWHSPDVRWVVWGLFIGAVLGVERVVQHRRAAANRAGSRARPSGDTAVMAPPVVAARRAISLVYVWTVLAISLTVATSDSLGDTVDLLARLTPLTGSATNWNLVGLAAGGLIALVLTDRRARTMAEVEGRPDPPTPWRSVGLAVMVLGIVVFSGTEPAPFVYFQF